MGGGLQRRLTRLSNTSPLCCNTHTEGGAVIHWKSIISERRAGNQPTFFPSRGGVWMSRTVIWLLAPLPSRAHTENVRPPADTATAAAASTLPAPLMVKLGSDKVKVADFLRQSETSTGSRRGEEKRSGGGVKMSLTSVKARS